MASNDSVAPLIRLACLTNMNISLWDVFCLKLTILPLNHVIFTIVNINVTFLKVNSLTEFSKTVHYH